MGNNPKPSVSIIMPTYNRGYCIEKAVGSILRQSYTNFELIIVDDASTDETPNIISNINDSRVSYFHLEENRGPSGARNVGLNNSSGVYIAFIDSDDEWVDYKLERQVELMESLPDDVGVIYCNADRKNFHGVFKLNIFNHVMPEHGIIYHRALDDYLSSITPGCMLVRRVCFDKVGNFDEKLRRFEDMDLLIRISQFYKFYHMYEPLLIQYMTEDSISVAGTGDPAIEALFYIFNKYEESYKKIPELYAKKLYIFGNFFCKKGHMDLGRRHLYKSLNSRFNTRALVSYVLACCGKNIFRLVYKYFGSKNKPPDEFCVQN